VATVGLVVVSGFAVYGLLGVRYLSDAGNPIAQQPEMVTVLVTKDEIPVGTRIKHPEQVFHLKELPKGQAPKWAFKNTALLKDKITNKTLVAGSPVTVDDLMKKDGGLTSDLPTGTRAMTIRVSPNDFVIPKNRVDVLAVTGNDGKPKVSVLLQNVVLLYFNHRIQGDEDGNTFKEAILQVTNEEAGILCGAADRQLRLIYHPTDD
jgi:Flp pilus assembly protein CpaB